MDRRTFLGVSAAVVRGQPKTRKPNILVVLRSMLVSRLRDAGYSTALIGKYHTGTRDESLRNEKGYASSVIEAHHPLNYGFDYYFGYNHHRKNGGTLSSCSRQIMELLFRFRLLCRAVQDLTAAGQS